MTQFTERKNINRGYMKLEVWQRAIDLFRFLFRLPGLKDLDVRLRSQLLDASQSVSANIAEGYGRNSIQDYTRYLYIALGSLAEAMTRMIGLKAVGLIPAEQFEAFDKLHYEVENKLVALIKRLETKKLEGGWENRLAEELETYGA